MQERFALRPTLILQKLRFQSAAMGNGAGTPRIAFNSVLMISICAEGLDVDIMRIFGPFCRAFFVPWEDMTFTARKTIFGTVTDLSFGTPAVATMTVRRRLAEKTPCRQGGPDRLPFAPDLAALALTKPKRSLMERSKRRRNRPETSRACSQTSHKDVHISLHCEKCCVAATGVRVMGGRVNEFREQ